MTPLLGQSSPGAPTPGHSPLVSFPPAWPPGGWPVSCDCPSPPFEDGVVRLSPAAASSTVTAECHQHTPVRNGRPLHQPPVFENADSETDLLRAKRVELAKRLELVRVFQQQ